MLLDCRRLCYVGKKPIGTGSTGLTLAAGGKPVGEIVALTTATGGMVTWCYVTDPEGNMIELQSWQTSRRGHQRGRQRADPRLAELPPPKPAHPLEIQAFASAAPLSGCLWLRRAKRDADRMPR